jgi:hypothetical protein
LLENEFLITEKGTHNHDLPVSKRDKVLLNNIKSFTTKHKNKPPSKIQIEFVKENPSVETPPLEMFQNAKCNLLNTG